MPKKFEYKPASELENFGVLVYNLLVENFPQTFFVGGTVRDLLLKREIKDIDLATSAKPEIVAEILKKHFIDFNLGYKNLGVTLALRDHLSVAIATFRTETYSASRYPHIKFVKEPKIDSQRRDFTINSLYLSLKYQKILDFHQGLADLKKRKINFIGDAKEKISEDPLRIVRALRFALQLDFKLEKKTFTAIKNKFEAVSTLSKARVKSEIEKLENHKFKKIIYSALNDKKNLDKFFKNR